MGDWMAVFIIICLQWFFSAEKKYVSAIMPIPSSDTVCVGAHACVCVWLVLL